MIRGYDEYGNVVDLVKREKEIYEEGYIQCRKDTIDILSVLLENMVDCNKCPFKCDLDNCPTHTDCRIVIQENLVEMVGIKD